MNKSLKTILVASLGSIIIVPILLILTIILALTAARKSHEGQLLYPVKQLEDKVELALTKGHEAKASLRFKLLERSIEEIQVATIRNDFDEVVDEAEDFRERAREITEDIAEITETGKNADILNSRLQFMIDNELKALQAAVEKASGNDKQAIENEIKLSQELVNQ